MYSTRRLCLLNAGSPNMPLWKKRKQWVRQDYSDFLKQPETPARAPKRPRNLLCSYWCSRSKKKSFIYVAIKLMQFSFFFYWVRLGGILNVMCKISKVSLLCMHTCLLSNRLPDQDHYQPLCPRVWRATSTAPLSTPLHHLHPVCLLRERRGAALRSRSTPFAQGPQSQLLSFHSPTGAFYMWGKELFSLSLGQLLLSGCSSLSRSLNIVMSTSRCISLVLCIWFGCPFFTVYGVCWLSSMFVVQKLLSECQSHRDCQMPVNHLLFGKDPCPGTTKYLHVDYKCKPSEFIGSNFTSVSARVFSHILKRIATRPHIKILPTPNSSSSVSYHHQTLLQVVFTPFFSPHSAEHKRHVVCEGETMVLRCKPPKVLNIYAAVYGRRLGHTDTCPSHLTRPPPFGEFLADDSRNERSENAWIS